MLGKWIRRLAFGAWALIAGCGGDEPFEPGTGGIMGSVSNAFGGDALPGVTVTVAGKSAQSDAVGQFELTGLPLGPQTLSATKDGYLAHSRSVTIVSGEISAINFSLTPDSRPVTLAAESGSQTGQIHLTWLASAHAESYTLYWSTEPGVTPATGTRIADLQGTSYDHSGLNPGTAYYYVLAPVHQGTQGQVSAEVSATAADGIAVRILLPGAGSLADTSIKVEVRVTSVYQLTSVTATVESRVTPLSFSGGAGGTWSATVPLAGLPSPRFRAVTFRATDINGTIATASQSFEHNRRAVVTLESPLPVVLTQPQFRLRISCQDDAPAGCANLKVIASTLPLSPSPISQELANGASPIDQDVSLASFDGRVVAISAQGTDDAGRLSSAGGIVYVDLSPHLTKVAEVTGVGSVIDASADRLLVLDSITENSHVGSLRIQSRTTGESIELLSKTFLSVSKALLTSHGAVFQSAETSGNIHVYEWRDNNLLDLGIGAILSVDLPYLLWFTNGTTKRRNLDSGATIDLPDDGGDVGPNGDVVSSSSLNAIKRFRDGVTTTIAPAEPNPTQQIVDLQTDGVNVTVVKGTAPSERVTLTAITDLGVDTLVAQERPSSGFSVVPVRLNGGWIAFTEATAGGAIPPWVRTPVGDHLQIGFFSGESAIDEVAPDGRVVFRNPVPGLTRLYLWMPGASATDIGSGLGWPVFISGQLHVMIGNALFRVN